MFYNGWGMSATMRQAILNAIPPTRPVVRCDHVTRDLCRERDSAPPPAQIVAYGVLDMEGYQVLATMVNGDRHQPRGDRLYHVTLSHDEGIPSSHAGVLLLAEQKHIKAIVPFSIWATPFVRAVRS